MIRILDFGFWILDSRNRKSKIKNLKCAGRVAPLVPSLLYALPSIAMACPLCKEALFEPGQLGQKLATAKAYALSIGLMLLVPTALVSGIVVAVLRTVRRAKRLAQPPRSS